MPRNSSELPSGSLKQIEIAGTQAKTIDLSKSSFKKFLKGAFLFNSL
jgi:hypothetical protein